MTFLNPERTDDFTKVLASAQHVERAGQGVGKDLGRAISLYKKACDGGHMASCSKLGYLYDKGRGVRKDLGKARRLWKKACDGGAKYACKNLKKL